MAILLEHLGFRRVATITKQRTLYAYERVLCALDEVDNLGEFLEIEALQPGDTEDIAELIIKLGLSEQPLLRSSYLELLKEVQ
jgi:predicted adenylyl cyclase CyaB